MLDDDSLTLCNKSHCWTDILTQPNDHLEQVDMPATGSSHWFILTYVHVIDFQFSPARTSVGNKKRLY